MKVDELLEMSRRMQRRLDGLQRSQAETIERLSAGIEDLKEVINAAGEAVKV